LAFDQAVQPQPPQLIGHLPLGACLGLFPQQASQVLAQLAVAKTTGQQTKQQQQMQKHGHQRLPIGQRRGPLLAHLARRRHRLKQAFAQRVVLTGPLDVQQTSVGSKAKLPHRGKIDQSAAEAKIPGIVDDGFRPQGPAFLEVLLDPALLVVDVQRGHYPLGDDAGTKAARGVFAHPPVEDQLHVVGSAEVEVLADDLLEEDPSGDGAVQHLGQGALRLQDGEVVAIARRAVLRGKGLRQPCQPFAQQGVDTFGSETIGQGLGALGMGTTAQPVGQGLESDAFLGELAVDVLMTIEAEPATVGEVGAELQEEQAEIGVHGVDVVLVDQRRGADDPGIRFSCLRIAPAFGTEGGDFLLSLANEQDALGAGKGSAVVGGEVFLAGVFLEGDQRDALLASERFDGVDEGVGHGLEVLGRNRAAAVGAEEVEHVAFQLQMRLVDVEVQTVQALQFEGHVVAQDSSNNAW
jgi:hypothetical protein